MSNTTNTLNLVLSERFGSQDAQELRHALDEHLTIGETSYLVRKSADPSLTSLIQLIGDAGAWLALSAPAAVYVSVLAKHAGDATWDWLRARFKSDDLKPLAAVSTQLAATADKVDGNVEFILNLNVPDDHWGTSITIRAREAVLNVASRFSPHRTPRSLRSNPRQHCVPLCR